MFDFMLVEEDLLKKGIDEGVSRFECVDLGLEGAAPPPPAVAERLVFDWLVMLVEMLALESDVFLES